MFMCVQRDVCFVPWTDIEVACYGYEGIDAVKDALRAGLNCSTEAMPIKVRSTSFISSSSSFMSCNSVIKVCIDFLSDQSDSTAAVRHDHHHSGAHRGSVSAQPGHDRHQGAHRGEARGLQCPDGGQTLYSFIHLLNITEYT